MHPSPAKRGLPFLSAGLLAKGRVARGSRGRAWISMVMGLTDSDAHVKDSFIGEFKNS